MVTRDRSLADAISQELARLMASTQRLVAEHSTGVERVADGLLHRSVLDGRALSELIQPNKMAARRQEPRLERRPFS